MFVGQENIFVNLSIQNKQINIQELEIKLKKAIVNRNTKKLQKILENTDNELLTSNQIRNFLIGSSSSQFDLSIYYKEGIIQSISQKLKLKSSDYCSLKGQHQQFQFTSALHAAVEYNDSLMVYLIINFCEIQKWIIPPFKFSTHLLHIACEKGYLDIAKVFLQKMGYKSKTLINFDINEFDDKGRTCLMLASIFGHLQIVELLLKEHADPNIEDNNGYNCFFLSILNKQKHLISLFLDFGFDLNMKNSKGITPLIALIQKGEEEMIEYLITTYPSNINLDLPDTNLKWTPLHYAAKYGEDIIVSLLVQHGAFLNPEDEQGRTPLYIASSEGYNIIVGYLLARKADPTICDMNNNSIISVAIGSTQLLLQTLLAEDINKN